MGRATGALLLLTLLGVGAAASASTNGTPQGFSVAARSGLAGGVEYLKLTRPSPVVAHVAHVAPGAPVDLKIVNADDKLSTDPTELETTSSMCGRVHCVVGVNGDFHDNGVPVGGVISDGRMLQSPDPGRPQLTVTKSGQLVAGTFPWTGTVTFADGSQIPVGAVNSDPPANGLALYTPDHGAGTAASTRTELLVKAPASVGSLNQPSDIQVRGVRSGAGPIPADGAVLSGDGAAGQQLLDAWNRQQKGMSPKARLVVNSPVDAGASLGAYPMVLQNGRPATPFGNDANLIYPQQPHTLVAWNKAGDIYLVAIDGRQTSSVGVTMAEAADFLLGLGATDGVNLDGGGGTTFVEDGRVVNRPSDPDPNHPGGYFERGATNAFVVIARPTAPPPTAPRAVTPLSVGPDGAPETASTTGPSATPSPTSPDGGVFGPVSGAIDQATPGDLPVGPSPAGAAASATAANPGAPTLRPQGVTTDRGTGEDAMAPPTTQPYKASGGEVHKVTDALRAPVSIASSITGQVFDATLGRASTGLPFRAGEAGAGLAGALAVTSMGTRRRRRPGARSAPPRPRLPETKPSTVASAPEIEAPPTLDVPAPKVEMPPAEVEMPAAEVEVVPAEVEMLSAEVEVVPAAVEVVPAGIDGELAEFEAELAELEVIAAELGADSPAPVFFREVPGHEELRLPESGSQITPQAWRSVSSASLRPTRSR